MTDATPAPANDFKIAMPPAPANPPATPRQFAIILAVDEDLGIGRQGVLPWHSKEDLKWFNETSSKAAKGKRNAIIMGVKTYFSLPSAFRPLDNRINIVLAPDTKRELPDELKSPVKDVIVYPGDLEACLTELGLTTPSPLFAPYASEMDRIFIGGGAGVYHESFFKPSLRRLLQTAYITRIKGRFGCDTIVPLPEGVSDLAAGLQLESRVEIEGKINIAIETWNLPNNEERQYLDLCKRIIETGCKKGDRTGTGTMSLFGAQMRFSLKDGAFPLLTTKRVFYRGIVEELLWFLRGDTDALHLSDKGVHIWDANGSREFLDGRGLKDNRVGDLGPVYGFQWRHFGADYTNCEADYKGKGVDQIREVIQTLRTNPNDRRMVVTAWNPAALSKMALPPCHMFAQFYVNDQQELSCMLYQRSCDMGLGVPFNIASYALLTYIIAAAAGLKVGEFVHTLGDAHVYLNHVDAVKEQLERTPRAFPTLVIKNHRAFLEDFVADDFELRDYYPYPTIKMDMAV